MHLSDEGLRLIKSFEGYHKRLQNGDCAAYLCPANVPTIGYGCTEGVKLGMVWTAEKAEEEFRKELSKFEAGVNRFVAAEINQNQFDALVSFAYNVGLGGLQKSTVLKRVNAGQFDKVPSALAAWNRGGGKVLPGLVSRRQREGALFMKPVEAPEEPYMPHKVETSSQASAKTVAAGGAAVGAGGAITIPVDSIPSPPDLTAVSAWKAFGQTLSELGGWAASHPVLTFGLGAWLVSTIFWNQIKAAWAEWRAS